ncbi:hypothetical protein [Phyllobacterium myrsinacearum]|uniref:hypothetical protein n=1 Tax=Phyllobacterium myrsinacearum TaxID=28101 RepID=UPI001029CB1D|nr:hypothetical protein [Phyllobacterium myrsinacearum]
MHPETAQGIAGAVARHDATDNLSTASFAKETASITGKDERTVRRDAERGEKVIDEVKDLITGTHLDTGAYLDKIKDLSRLLLVVLEQKGRCRPFHFKQNDGTVIFGGALI